jgi:membrane protein implicated in regulation of membrane protease activity
MIPFRPFEFALLAAIILLIFEVFTGTFVFLSFCVGSLAVAAAELLIGRFELGRDALLFAAVSTIAIVALRLAFRHGGDTKHAKGDINDY